MQDHTISENAHYQRGSCCVGECRTQNQYTKGILHNLSPMADPVMEDPLIYVQTFAGEGFSSAGF